jgi:hypothetical protein
MPELDLGNVKGPQGKSAYQSALDAGYSGSEEAFNTAMAKAPDAVLYTAQTLTDEQKAQARGNINAAPGGFGIGETPKRIADANDAVKNGRYAVDQLTLNLPGPIGDLWSYTYLDVYTGNRPDVYIKQTITSPYQGWHQCEVTRCFYSPRGGWQPWEWVNPPMLLGVEYRTTERYLGKPVYTKVIEGSFSGAGTTTISHGIANIDKCVAANGIALQKDSSYNFSFPYWFADGSTLTQGLSVSINSSAIQLSAVSDYSAAFSVQITVKYTKTTD